MNQPHFRALRCGPDQVLLGVSSDQPQLLTGLPPQVVDHLLQLPPLTATHWPQIFHRAGDQHLAALLRTAVARLTPADLRGSTARVDGKGPVADAVRALLAALETAPVDHPAAVDVRVVVGGPVDVDPHRSGAARFTLPVEVGSDRVVVGPLLRPAEGPCPRCLQLRRADQFTPWPLVLAQLHDVAIAEPAPVTAPELNQMAAALVGLVLRGIAAGRPLAPGLALAVTTPDPSIEHRFWPVHPRCRCSAALPVRTWEAAG